jgi:predicted secreted Zn-dependent protease
LASFTRNGEIEMTTIKLLSAGMIAAAMLATPVMARDNHMARRHVTENAIAGDSSAARYVDGQVCIPAPRVGAFATEPWVGGNTPCEPGSY